MGFSSSGSEAAAGTTVGAGTSFWRGSGSHSGAAAVAPRRESMVIMIVFPCPFQMKQLCPPLNIV